MLRSIEPTVWQQPDLAAFRLNVLNRPVESLNTGWEDVLVPLGLALAGKAFADADMLAWVGRWVDYHLGVPAQRLEVPDFRSQGSGKPFRGLYLTPYCGEWGAGMVFAELHQHAPDDRLVAAVREMADHIIAGSIRIGNGVIAHGQWSRLAWVDTMYYTAAPLARAYALTGEERYAREAVQQCLLHSAYLRDEHTGLFFHEANPDSGQRTSWFWARGNGWVILALIDTLRYCPPETPGWQQVLAIYRAQVAALLRMQHSCGLWRIIPENQESHLETSGSIMIATGIATGIHQGWLDESLQANVRRTWNEVRTWINADGALLGCQTPAGLGGWETHKRSMMGERTYGAGSLLRLAAEMRAANLL
jgi:rhamnogalacturonyl hydrolase YesR